MKILLISDIHANIEALKKIDETYLNSEIDEIWFLGDVSDRGPDPAGVLSWLNENIKQENWLLGNHDSYLLGIATKNELVGVNPKILKSNARQRKELNNLSVQMERLGSASKKPIVKNINGTKFVLTHGCPSDPIGHNRSIYSWTSHELIEDEFKTLVNETGSPLSQIVCIVGHTHIPTLLSIKSNNNHFQHRAQKIENETYYKLNSDKHWFLNPGSVGSPRDLDPRACCAVLNINKNDVGITFHRTTYDIDTTAEKLLVRNYDTIWADRLYDAEPPEGTPDEWLKYFGRYK